MMKRELSDTVDSFESSKTLNPAIMTKKTSEIAMNTNEKKNAPKMK
jgi:hypothetical protein